VVEPSDFAIGGSYLQFAAGERLEPPRSLSRLASGCNQIVFTDFRPVLLFAGLFFLPFAIGFREAAGAVVGVRAA